MCGKSVPWWVKISPLPSIRTGSGARLAFYSLDTAGSVLAGVWDKSVTAWCWPTPFSTSLRMNGSTSIFLSCVFVLCIAAGYTCCARWRACRTWIFCHSFFSSFFFPLWALHVQYAYCMLAWSSRIENRRCGSEVVGRICRSSEAVINGCGGTLLEWLLAKEKKPCPLVTNLSGLPGCPRRWDAKVNHLFCFVCRWPSYRL